MSNAPAFHYHRLRKEESALRDWEVQTLFAIRKEKDDHFLISTAAVNPFVFKEMDNCFTISAASIDPSLFIDPTKDFLSNLANITAFDTTRAKQYGGKDTEYVRAFRAGMRSMARDRFKTNWQGNVPRFCIDTTIDLTEIPERKIEPKRRIAPARFMQCAIIDGNTRPPYDFTHEIKRVPNVDRALSRNNTAPQDKIYREAIGVAVRNYAYHINPDVPFLIKTRPKPDICAASLPPSQTMTAEAFRKAPPKNVSPDFAATRLQSHPVALWNALLIGKLIADQPLNSYKEAVAVAEVISHNNTTFVLGAKPSFD